MARMPGAEVPLGEDLIRRLLAAQHPDLAGLPLGERVNGWDNVMVRLGPDLAVRLPRRAAAADLVRREQAWLPRLAPLVEATGVRVPVPVRTGRQGAGYPWPWSVVPWLPGASAAAVPRSERRFAGTLAAFCRALHRPAPAGAPVNPVRGVPLRARDAAVRARLATGAVPHAGEVGRLWEDLVGTAPWDGPARWLHGDLHPANMVVRDGALVAVVDFGDVTAGDPATDLATAWLTLDAASRAELRAALADRYPASVWPRARGWALGIGAALCAHSDDAPGLRRLGEETVAAVLKG